MKVDENKCVGCGNCVIVCPMEAIHIEGDYGYGKAYIDQDKCVECGACKRFVSPEDANPTLVNAARRTIRLFKLRYDQPIDICPTSALYQPELEWPRVLRQVFSDPVVSHTGTNTKGRGTEEIKTNDVTGRLKKGQCGILVEFGRPGIGARFYEVERVSRAISQVEGIRFEESNPITQMMRDRSQGLLEIIMQLEKVAEVLESIEKSVKDLDTVVSIDINAKAGYNGEIPYEDEVTKTNFKLSPNGKINLGLGRILEQEAGS